MNKHKTFTKWNPYLNLEVAALIQSVKGVQLLLARSFTPPQALLMCVIIVIVMLALTEDWVI